MHGSPDSQAQVLTLSEYQAFDLKSNAMKALVLSYLLRHPILIVGAGLTDPNFLKLYSIVHESFGRFHHPAFYVSDDMPAFCEKRLGAFMLSSIVVQVLFALSGRGAESYPSKDKAVIFFEVPDLKSAIAATGQDRLVQSEDTWAVLHDPGHNILLLQRSSERAVVRS
jgi:hypothetical protein